MITEIEPGHDDARLHERPRGLQTQGKLGCPLGSQSPVPEPPISVNVCKRLDDLKMAAVFGPGGACACALSQCSTGAEVLAAVIDPSAPEIIRVPAMNHAA